MRCVIAFFILFLLAGSVNDRRAPAPAPDSTRGPYVDRHVDAHLPTRGSEPAASVPDDRSERRARSDPASGVLQPSPSLPATPLYRDPLYRDPLHRDRRY
jgi:hypothetical protein